VLFVCLAVQRHQIASPLSTLHPSSMATARGDRMWPQPIHYTAPSLTLPACEFCSQEHDLTLCDDCQSVYYCDWEHQYQGDHEEKCARIVAEKKELNSMLARHKRNKENGAIETDDVESFGSIGPYPDSRDVARAYIAVVKSVLDAYGQKGGRLQAVQHALELLEAIVAMKIKDLVGTRQLVPACYIRLGRYYEAYEYIGSFDYSKHPRLSKIGIMMENFNVSAPNLLQTQTHFRGLDGQGSPHFVDRHFVKFVMLLKIPIFFELVEIEKTYRPLRHVMIPEMSAAVQKYLSSPTLAGYQQNGLWTDEHVHELKLRVKDEIKQLFRALHKDNPNFWLQLLIDVGALPPQQGRTPGGDDRLQGHGYPEWAEMPGAVDIVMILGGFVNRARE
jgi:hypothetical protein